MNIIGWAKAHKIAAAGVAAGLAIVLVGGGFAISAATQNPAPSLAQEQYDTASDGWDTAQKDFEAAVVKRDAAVEKTPAARVTGVTNQAQAKTAFDAAIAAKVDVKPLRTLSETFNDLLTEETFGIVEGDDAHVVLTPEVPDTKPELVKGDDDDLVLFAGKLDDDIRQFEEATKEINFQTRSAEAFIFDMTDAAHISEAYLKSAPNVLTYTEGAGATDAAAVLKAAIAKKTVTAQNLIDAFNAVTVLKGGTPIVVPETPGSSTNPGGDTAPRNETSPGNNNPAPPVVEPPAPPVVEPPAPSVPIGDANSELAGRYGTNNVGDSCYPANSGSSTSAAGLPAFGGVGAKGWDVWADGDRWYVSYWSC